ncbi:MAG: hypothetical protein WBC73_03545, partial [Phormidesmis sp.]
GEGNGGNINIDSDFVVTNPFEDSDIIAKATQGRGGNIEIDTFGLYGIAERRAIANNGTNDIDASSDFGVSGTLALNQLIEESGQGVVALSEQALETSAAVAQGCQANGNRLIFSRRGGLPLAPTSAAEINPSLVDLGRSYPADSPSALNHSGEAATEAPPETISEAASEIKDVSESSWVEASGWTTDEDNQVVLTAPPQGDSAIAGKTASNCAG